MKAETPEQAVRRRIYDREHYAANREEMRARGRAYYAAHPRERGAYQRAMRLWEVMRTCYAQDPSSTTKP